MAAPPGTQAAVSRISGHRLPAVEGSFVAATSPITVSIRVAPWTLRLRRTIALTPSCTRTPTSGSSGGRQRLLVHGKPFPPGAVGFDSR